MKHILFSLLLAVSLACTAQERLGALVTHVEDGDTIHVRLTSGRKDKIRIWGIDAPETCHKSNDFACTKRPGQPYGEEATKRMTELVDGKQVLLICNGQQSHSRSVCQVHVGNADAGLVLVQDGLAHHLPKFLGDPEYADAQSKAKQRRMGLWSRADAMLPEVWRDQCWKNGVCRR